MKSEWIECIALVSVKCDMGKVNKLEYLQSRQEKHIRKYAKAHRIEIVEVLYTQGQAQIEINRKFDKIINLIKNRRVQGIITANMRCISSDLKDAYFKVGRIRSAGGEIYTVEEGRLKLEIEF